MKQIVYEMVCNLHETTQCECGIYFVPENNETKCDLCREQKLLKKEEN
jgi:hypothetical protein